MPKLSIILLCFAVVAGVLWDVSDRRWVEAAAYDPYPDLHVKREANPQPMQERTVYLTFDDGPSRNTEALLAVLREEEVPATFFVIGSEEEEDLAMVRKIHQEGHTVAPHTYCHRYHIIYRSVEDYLEDFNRNFEFVREATGAPPTIFRFPGGSKNSGAPSKWVMGDIVTEMEARGFTYYDWNIVSGDDTATVYPPEILLDNIVRGAKDVDSPVILFHDAPLCKTTPQAVKMVIAHYKALGYRFAALTPTVEPIQFYAQYGPPR